MDEVGARSVMVGLLGSVAGVLLGGCGSSATGCDPSTLGEGPALPCESDEAQAAEGGREPRSDVATTAAWQKRVAATLTNGDELALRVDAEGVPHIAYQDAASRELQHAWLQGGGFASERIDGDSHGWQKSWVVGSPDLRLVYDNYLFSTLSYAAVRDGAGAWSVETEEHPRSVAASTAVWRDGRAQVARMTSVATDYQYDGIAITAWRQGVAFDGSMPDALARFGLEPITPGLALAVDSAGTAHIVYHAPSDDLAEAPGEVLKTSELATYAIRYVTVADGRWSEPETLSEAALYQGLSLMIDAVGRVHVTFCGSDHFASDGMNERYLATSITHLERDGGGAWVREVVPATGIPRLARGSLQVDAGGDVHLVYWGRVVGTDRGAVRYLSKHAGVWADEVIEEGCEQLGTAATLALGADGSPHVAYRNCTRELLHATRSAR